MEHGHFVQVIAVTSGKGGVGKTVVAINLSLALAELGKRVVLLEADLGLPNIGVLLGLSPQYTLADLMEGRCELSDVLMQGPGGVLIVHAASGAQSPAHLSPAQYAGLIQVFSDIADTLDVLVIDTASGIGESVVTFVRAAQEILLVVCDDPASITDAYALIKLLNREHGINRFRVLINLQHNAIDGQRLFARLRKVIDSFLDVTLQYVGTIPYDQDIRKAAHQHRALYQKFPASKSAKEFRAIAKNMSTWPMPGSPRGHVEFFVEALVNNSRR